MLFLPALVILTAMVYSHGEVLVEDDRLVFQRRDGDLSWPLPDNTDPGALWEHGTHCLEQVQKPNHTDSNLDRMHKQHCQNVLAMVVRFFETNPSYYVNEWICATLSKNRGKRSKFNYNCYIKSCNGGKKKRSVETKNGNQDDVLTQLAAQNFGNVLMKNWTDPGSLSQAESAYLQRWESRPATAIGAMSIYCKVKGDINALRDLLN